MRMSRLRFQLIVLGALVLAATAGGVILMKSAPAEANPATNFEQVSAGQDHTCGVTTGGAVKCWGSNVYGQLGDGGACGAICPVPVAVSGLGAGVASVSAGQHFACAVTEAGAARCWGRNTYGQLGDGTTTNQSTSVAVMGLTSGVMEVSAGDTHACARTGAGALRCWGRNFDGQLGDTSNTDRLTPVAVSGISSGATDIDAGGSHTCAVVSGGARCWGRNVSGQLGNGTTMSSNAPVGVTGLSGGVMDIAAGFNFACARAGAGAVKCWGDAVGGQLGDGQTCSPYYCATPTDVSGIGSGASELAAGGTSSGPGSPQACALLAIGVKCWGDNWNGELGTDTGQVPAYTPINMDGDTTSFASLSLGGHHGCAVTATGGVSCWGLNTSGQLGIGTTGGEYYAPQVVVAVFAKPTATPTSSPTPCPLSICPVNFWFTIDTYPPLGQSCDTFSGSATCSAPLNSILNLKVYLDKGGVAAYDALGVMLQYSSLTSGGNLQMEQIWPDCHGQGATSGPEFVSVGCSVLAGPSSAYTGIVAIGGFSCVSDGTITMVHSPSDTELIDSDGNTQYETGGDETLTINCVSPQAYPTDTDGDGCPDMNESLPNPQAGGQRNFLNPYDYFNPSHDGQNRIDDVLDVVDQYFVDDGDVGYLADTDRTLLGPNAWNLGPPDGLQRVDDILNQVKQYFHDCT